MENRDGWWWVSTNVIGMRYKRVQTIIKKVKRPHRRSKGQRDKIAILRWLQHPGLSIIRARGTPWGETGQRAGPGWYDEVIHGDRGRNWCKTIEGGSEELRNLCQENDRLQYQQRIGNSFQSPKRDEVLDVSLTAYKCSNKLSRESKPKSISQSGSHKVLKPACFLYRNWHSW